MTPPVLQARYGAQAPAVSLPHLPALDTLLHHRTVRHFLGDALPEHTIETLVAAAQSAPTSSNLQTWSVIAVESQARRDQLAQLVGQQKHLSAAPLFPVFGLVVGHPDPARPAAIKPRLPQSAVLHREQYHVPATPQEEIGDYNAALAAFMRAQGMPEVDWSTQVVDRLMTPESLSGRHRLYEALRNAGFCYTDIDG